MGDDDTDYLSTVEERLGVQTIEADISEQLASPSAVDTAKGLSKKLTLECSYAAVFSTPIGTLAHLLSISLVGETVGYTTAVGAAFTMFYTKGVFCRFGSARRADSEASDPRE